VRIGRERTPLEAVELSETLEQLFAVLDEEDRPVLELSLQGHATREISERLGRVRRRLERM
jgi:RNA polymerase sigma-70 factor (ECF subfamily)